MYHKKSSSENDQPHPNCGNKIIKKRLEGGIEFHKQLNGKARKYGIKKPFKEFRIGYDFFKKIKKWIYKERYIDRKNNDYEESVIDTDTGKVIHKCKEPLSEHTYHGSAKKIKNKGSHK